MKTFKLPGFSAEASLGRRGRRYRQPGDFARADAEVIPQACDAACLDRCGTLEDCDDPDLPPGFNRERCRAAVRLCQRRCCPPTPAPRCDPCPAPSCNPDCSQLPRTQLCHNADGGTFTRPC